MKIHALRINNNNLLLINTAQINVLLATLNIFIINLNIRIHIRYIHLNKFTNYIHILILYILSLFVYSTKICIKN